MWSKLPLYFTTALLCPLPTPAWGQTSSVPANQLTSNLGIQQLLTLTERLQHINYKMTDNFCVLSSVSEKLPGTRYNGILDNSASQNTCPVSRNAVHERNTRESAVSNCLSNTGDQALSSGANIQNQPQLYLPIDADVVESRIRALNLPRLEEDDDIDAYVRAHIPKDFPGRSIRPNYINSKDLSYSKILGKLKSELNSIVHRDQPHESALPTVADGKRQFSYLKSSYKLHIDRSWEGHTVLLQRIKSTYFAYSTLFQALTHKKAILLMYCKKDDRNTYYELIWHPNDEKYTAETLLAYHTRYYHYVTFTSVAARKNTKTTEDFLRKVLKSPSANICSGEVNKSGNIVFYSL